MNDVDRDALRTAAENATPGPWSAGTIYALVSPSQIDGFIWPREREQEDARIRADRGFIAAADPPTVLALLDALAAAEARAVVCEHQSGNYLAMMRERDEQKARADRAGEALSRIEEWLNPNNAISWSAENRLAEIDDLVAAYRKGVDQ